MGFKLWAWNLLSFILHFALLAGVLLCLVCYMGPELGGPVMFFSGLWSCFSLWQQRSLMKMHLQRHGDTHEFSPNLKKIVAEVCAAAGKDPARVPLYDYTLNKPSNAINSSVLRKLGWFMLNARSHAAATTGDMLLVSGPLLKLLDDEEEKGVFAHEMAHVVLKHHMLSGLIYIAQAMVPILGWAWVISALWHAGWNIAVLTVTLHFVLYYVSRKVWPILGKSRGLTAAERRQRVLASAFYSLLYLLVIGGFLGAMAPPVLKAYFAKLLADNVALLISAHASRRREFQADAGAVALGGPPLAFAMALRKIVFLQDRAQRKLFESTDSSKPADRSLSLYATHPPLAERVEALCHMAMFEGGAQWADMQKARHGTIDLPVDHDIPEDVVRAYNRM